MNLALSRVLQSAKTYSRNRVTDLCGWNTRAKLGVKEVAEELELAAIFGELSCLERITALLVDDRNLDRGDIEAAIHVGIVDYYNFIREEVGGKRRINLDKYLEMRGYT